MAVCAEMVPASALREMLDASIETPRLDIYWPVPGERNPWGDVIWIGHGEGDDGGGAALAAYRFGRCPFAK